MIENYCDFKDPDVVQYWLNVLQVILLASLTVWVVGRVLFGKSVGPHLGFAATAA